MSLGSGDFGQLPGFSRRQRRLFEPEKAAAIEQGARKGARLVPPVAPPRLVRNREIEIATESIYRRQPVTVLGPGGIGTSTVAIEACRRATSDRGRFIYLDLTHVERPEEAARKFLLALEVPLQAMQRPTVDPGALAKSYISADDVVLFDNCRDSGLIADLQLNIPSAVMASRASSGDPSQARRSIALSPLTPSQSHDLLLGASADATLPDADRRMIAERFYGWPILLRIAAGILLQGTDTAAALASMSTGSDPVSVMANVIWAMLPQDVARVLSALVAADWLQVNTSNVAVLAGVSSGSAKSSLDYLYVLGLLQKVPRSFRLQNSMRVALRNAKSAPLLWRPQHLNSALKYVRTRVQRTERQLEGLSYWSKDRVESYVPSSSIRRGYSTLSSDVGWLEREWTSIVRLLEEVSGSKPLKEVTDVVGSLRSCLEPLGRLDDLQRLEELQYRAARAYGSLQEQRTALRRLAQALDQEGKLLDAIATRGQALALSREADDPRQVGVDLLELARLRSKAGEEKAATAALEEAVAIFRDERWIDGEARALLGLGEIYEGAGEADDAAAAYARAIQIMTASSNRRDRAAALLKLGAIHQGRGRLKEARAAFADAAATIESSDEPTLVAFSLEQLGGVAAQEGQHEEAIDALRRALVIYKEMRDSSGEVHTLLTLAQIEAAVDNLANAERYYFDAMKLATQLEDDLAVGNSRAGLGELFVKQGNWDKALQYLEQAVRSFSSAGLRKEEADALRKLVDIHVHRGDHRTAVSSLLAALDIYHTINNEHGIIVSSQQLGALYQYLKDDRKAASYFEESAAQARRIGDRDAEATALEELRRSYLELHLPNEAAAIEQRLRYLAAIAQE